MQSKKALIALGALVALSPFIGLPRDVLVFLLPILGVLIGVVSSMTQRTDRVTEEVSIAHDSQDI